MYVEGNRDQLFDLMMLTTHESQNTLTEHLTVVRLSQLTRDTILPCELQCPLEIKAWTTFLLLQQETKLFVVFFLKAGAALDCTKLSMHQPKELH